MNCSSVSQPTMSFANRSTALPWISAPIPNALKPRMELASKSTEFLNRGTIDSLQCPDPSSRYSTPLDGIQPLGLRVSPSNMADSALSPRLLSIEPFHSQLLSFHDQFHILDLSAFNSGSRPSNNQCDRHSFDRQSGVLDLTILERPPQTTCNFPLRNEIMEPCPQTDRIYLDGYGRPLPRSNSPISEGGLRGGYSSLSSNCVVGYCGTCRRILQYIFCCSR